MGDRTPFVVGLLAIAAVVAWLVLRESDTPESKPASPAGSAALTARPTPEPSLPKPTGPTPAPELVPQAPTAEDVFSEEPRDDAWAVKTEAELAKRWKQIRGGTVESIECRRTRCRVLLVGPQNDIAAALADLEGPRGLHGYAQNVHLTAPQQRADDIALRIFVRFER